MNKYNFLDPTIPFILFPITILPFMEKRGLRGEIGRGEKEMGGERRGESSS